MRQVFMGSGLALTLAMAACNNPETVQAEAAEEQDAASSGNIPTQVLTSVAAQSVNEDWGVFTKYFEGDTAGITSLLSGTATIKPGQEIHPPHQHVEEEFLMVLEGEGTWTVGEESFAATKGDMLYAAAWDLHGIKNTGDSELTFVFWKWHSKGTDKPAPPEGVIPE